MADRKTNQRSQITQDIKALDIELLDVLLDDDRTYMEVSKTQFLDKLKEKFEIMKEAGHHSFDDVFFGVCQGCQKGCEGMTFLSDAGYYIEILIKEEKGAVVDVRICYDVVNFVPLEKTIDLRFEFPIDDCVNFVSHERYRRIEQECKTIIEEASLLASPIKLEDYVAWYTRFYWFRDTISSMDWMEIMDFRLYANAFLLLEDIKSVAAVKTKELEAIDILIDYHEAKTERDQLIWFFENIEDFQRLTSIVIPQDFDSHSCIKAQIRDQTIRVDISGYEHVLDYFKKIDSIYNYFLDKYQPLPEHLKEDHHLSFKNLEVYLRLHNVHMDIVERNYSRILLSIKSKNATNCFLHLTIFRIFALYGKHYGRLNIRVSIENNACFFRHTALFGTSDRFEQPPDCSKRSERSGENYVAFTIGKVTHATAIYAVREFRPYLFL